MELHPPCLPPSVDASHGSTPFRPPGREGVGSCPLRCRHGYNLATFASKRPCIKKSRNRRKCLSLLDLSIIAGGGFEPPTSGLWARRATRLLYPAVNEFHYAARACLFRPAREWPFNPMRLPANRCHRRRKPRRSAKIISDSCESARRFHQSVPQNTGKTATPSRPDRRSFSE